MKLHPLLFLVGFSATPLVAKEVQISAVDSPKAEAGEDKAKSDKSVNDDLARLESLNKLDAEKLTRETTELREEIARLKLDRDLITARLALESAKRDEAVKDAVAEAKTKIAELSRESEFARIKSEKLSFELKSVQSETAMELVRLQSEIETIQVGAKRESFVDIDPVYLEQPLRDDGVLVISDRRIPLNGLISSTTADYITDRIDFWNNHDKKLPIFIVIDECPGGSVMAGYRILKAMETSEAPVHVVVKSFAASMAACITTLAEESYAYPNAIILHHQISSQIAFARLNLTQQKEFYQESQRWWERLAEPVAKKMGITTEDFIEQMYSKSTSGDWSEFGDGAKELKWVKHIVEGIVESAINVNPDVSDKSKKEKDALVEQTDPEGKAFAYLPRLSPKDVYFLYNPDSYYRLR